MAHHGWEFATALESRLREGLPALCLIAGEIGAKSVSVFRVKDGRSIQNLYVWPEPAKKYADALQLDRALGDVLRDSAGYVPGCSPIAKFLNTAFQIDGTSFLIFSWGTQHYNAAIAFGFTVPSAPEVLLGGDIPTTVKLASVATWSVYETLRLHSELAIVNERLGKRKLIERAKGLLHVEHGLDEQQAYEHLRRLSRQRRMRMSDIAKDLLGTLPVSLAGSSTE